MDDEERWNAWVKLQSLKRADLQCRNDIQLLFSWTQPLVPSTSVCPENPLFQSSESDASQYEEQDTNRWDNSMFSCPFDGSGLRWQNAGTTAPCAVCWERKHPGNPIDPSFQCSSCKDFRICRHCYGVMYLRNDTSIGNSHHQPNIPGWLTENVPSWVDGSNLHQVLRVVSTPTPFFEEESEKRITRLYLLMDLWLKLMRGDVKLVSSALESEFFHGKDWVSSRLLNATCYFNKIITAGHKSSDAGQMSTRELTKQLLTMCSPADDFSICLHAAIQSKSIGQVKEILMDSRTNVSGFSTAKGMKLMHFKSRPLTAAVCANFPDACAALLLHEQCDPSVDQDDAVYTAAKLASEQGNLILALLLKDFRVDPSRRKSTCLTVSGGDDAAVAMALLRDCRTGMHAMNFEFLRIMIKFGQEAPLGVFLSMYPKFNFMKLFPEALHHAAYGYAGEGLVQQLIDHGAICKSLEDYRTLLVESASESLSLTGFFIRNISMLVPGVSWTKENCDSIIPEVFVQSAWGDPESLWDALLAQFGPTVLSKSFHEALLKACSSRSVEGIEWLLDMQVKHGWKLSTEETTPKNIRRMIRSLANVDNSGVVEQVLAFLSVQSGFSVEAERNTCLQAALLYGNKSLMLFLLKTTSGGLTLTGSTSLVPAMRSLSESEFAHFCDRLDVVQESIRNPRAVQMALLHALLDDHWSKFEILQKFAVWDTGSLLELLASKEFAASAIARVLEDAAVFPVDESNTLRALVAAAVEGREKNVAVLLAHLEAHAAPPAPGTSSIFRGFSVETVEPIARSLARAIESTSNLNIIRQVAQTAQALAVELPSTEHLLTSLAKAQPASLVAEAMLPWLEKNGELDDELLLQLWKIAGHRANTTLCWLLLQRYGFKPFLLEHVPDCLQMNKKESVRILTMILFGAYMSQLPTSNSYSHGTSTPLNRHSNTTRELKGVLTTQPDWDVLLLDWQAQGVPPIAGSSWKAIQIPEFDYEYLTQFYDFQRVFAVLQTPTCSSVEEMAIQQALRKGAELSNALDTTDVDWKTYWGLVKDIPSYGLLSLQHIVHGNVSFENLINLKTSLNIASTGGVSFSPELLLEEAYQKEVVLAMKAFKKKYGEITERVGFTAVPFNPRWTLIYVWFIETCKVLDDDVVGRIWEVFATVDHMDIFRGIDRAIAAFGAACALECASHCSLVLPDFTLDTITRFVGFHEPVGR